MCPSPSNSPRSSEGRNISGTASAPRMRLFLGIRPTSSSQRYRAASPNSVKYAVPPVRVRCALMGFVRPRIRRYVATRSKSHDLKLMRLRPLIRHPSVAVRPTTYAMSFDHAIGRSPARRIRASSSRGMCRVYVRPRCACAALATRGSFAAVRPFAHPLPSPIATRVSMHIAPGSWVARFRDEASHVHATTNRNASHVHATGCADASPKHGAESCYRRSEVFTYQSCAFQSRSLGATIGMIRRPCSRFVCA